MWGASLGLRSSSATFGCHTLTFFWVTLTCQKLPVLSEAQSEKELSSWLRLQGKQLCPLALVSKWIWCCWNGVRPIWHPWQVPTRAITEENFCVWENAKTPLADDLLFWNMTPGLFLGSDRDWKTQLSGIRWSQYFDTWHGMSVVSGT